MGESICACLVNEGFNVDWIQDPEQVIDRIHNTEYDVVMPDLCLRHISDTNFLRKISADVHNASPIVLIVERNAIDQAEKLLDLGSVEYIIKERDPTALIKKLREMCCNSSSSDLQKQDHPLGVSPAMSQLEEKLQILAPYDQTHVLIVGESGVGKEVVARRLHSIQDSPGPFVAINCAAIPHSLIEAELFGHEKGAFTGSTKTHKGVFEQASGGTLLLDEIGEMPLETQAKLLRVSQEQTVVRLGGEQDIPVNLRMICATNGDLHAKIECGEFREDLYYRINVIELQIPPLRKRREDILWLANKFLNCHIESYPDKVKRLDELASQSLIEHSWPGNVRELKNAIERAFIMASGPTIFAHDIFPQQPEFTDGDDDHTLTSFLLTRERAYIDGILKEHDWNIMNSAARLGISRKNLWEKMKKYDMHKAALE
ncbi:MAG: sigma-54 dependent transcriptional regulator [Gammaproteobacteria bacterium]|nr:sigma-54 dependent transcriptional regulator [Gammaproteobacteria bacterium]